MRIIGLGASYNSSDILFRIRTSSKFWRKYKNAEFILATNKQCVKFTLITKNFYHNGPIATESDAMALRLQSP